MKDKLLLILKLPPPLTGATLMNTYVAQSEILKNSLNVRLLGISYKTNIEHTSVSLKKAFVLLKALINLAIQLIFFKPKVAYFQISPLGYAFYRDCLFVFMLRMFKTHTILHLHGKGINRYIGSSKIKKRIYKWAFNEKHISVICLSTILTTDIKSVYKGSPYIVANAIQQKTDDYPLVKKNSTINILFLSNLIISKGILVFIDAIKQLKKNTTCNFHVHIVGKEVELTTQELTVIIQNNELDQNITYHGAVYGNDKYKLLKSSNILVYPTLEDVWGLVILEAMQFGLPVIATNEGAIPEIVDDGITGFIVEKRNPQAISEKVKLLIDNPDLRTQMGEAGRKKFREKYTIEIFEKNLVNVFKQVISTVE